MTMLLGHGRIAAGHPWHMNTSMKCSMLRTKQFKTLSCSSIILPLTWWECVSGVIRSQDPLGSYLLPAFSVFPWCIAPSKCEPNFMPIQCGPYFPFIAWLICIVRGLLMWDYSHQLLLRIRCKMNVLCNDLFWAVHLVNWRTCLSWSNFSWGSVTKSLSVSLLIHRTFSRLELVCRPDLVKFDMTWT